MTVVGAVTSIVAPYLFSRAIDDMSHGGPSDAILDSLLIYAIVFGMAAAISQIARYLAFLCSERLTFIANSRFFSRLLAKEPGFFLRYNAAQVITARQEGEQTLRIIIQLTIGGLLPGGVQIIVSVILLGSLISWELAVVVLSYGSIVVSLDYFRVVRVRPQLDKVMEQGQKNSHLLGNTIDLIETLRQTQSEKWISNRYETGAHLVFRSWRRYTNISGIFSIGFGIASAIQLVIAFFLIIPLYTDGFMSIGEVVLFNTLLLQLNEPFHLLGITVRQAVEAYARFRPLASMWTAPEVGSAGEWLPYSPSAGSICFENVTFTYSGGGGIRNLSFVVKRGIPTFLIGETGSGKSTVLQLLLKSVKPTSGRILVDDIDLADVARSHWFAYVGVVPQDLVLLNDTLSTNIVLGRPFDKARLNEAARRASILDIICKMPDGFETIVGERGLRLSGGERQRVAIARALYGRPKVLILDEASSSLDEGTENAVMDSLRDCAGDLTILAVTHRRSTIIPSDQVIELNRPKKDRTNNIIVSR